MKLKETIETAWDNRELLGKNDVQKAIHEVVDQLDRGVLQVAQKEPNGWKVNDWVKKAVIL
ncbi:MAG: 2,3,4,5-tetrahydropyridine-2,6-dicarboxylate N-succinyltransferase, partial [Bacteroidales bacterium]|nr:2,3,4,5-tetrahydropyridine-2,6-dicarboxylate N-succinyltransferase [Bacteroidales bacterium]